MAGAMTAVSAGEVPQTRRTPWLDLKSIIAILIGVVSVTGAVVTWRAALLSEYATDNDRQAVAETVLRQKAEVNARLEVGAQERDFARYRSDIIAADRLDADAEALRGQGREIEAQAAENESTARRREADELASLSGFSQYLGEDDGGLPTFDVDRSRQDLVRDDTEAAQVDPAQTSKRADDLRAHSQRLVGWIAVFVGAVVLLTLAQVINVKVIRAGLAALGVVVYVFATVGALLAGRG